MTTIKTIVRSAAEARGFLQQKGDAAGLALADHELPAHLLRQHNVVCDANARLEGEPAPAVRVDAVPSAGREYRTDQATPPKPAKYDPLEPYRRAFAAARGDEQSADAKQRAAREGDTNLSTSPELNPVTGAPLTSYERYARDYYRQRAKTATRDLLTPTAPRAPAPQGAAPVRRDAAQSRRQADFAKLAAIHADRSQDAIDPSVRGQAPTSAAKADPGGFFAKCEAAFQAARGKAVNV
jgi:hypothetical protein